MSTKQNDIWEENKKELQEEPGILLQMLISHLLYKLNHKLWYWFVTTYSVPF